MNDDPPGAAGTTLFHAHLRATDIPAACTMNPRDASATLAVPGMEKICPIDSMMDA